MERPTSVGALCEQRGLDVHRLRLPCVFCKCFMHFSEVEAFDRKGLQLSWKDGVPHGCCARCARVTSGYERRFFSQGALTGQGFLHVYKDKFTRIPVRCYLCLGLLSTADLVDAIQEGQHLELVRGRWRARCPSCRE
nr:MAG: E6 protein [Leptonychotes weddellii papillomavirus 10]